MHPSHPVPPIEPEAGGRPHRSRKNRPCDPCRRRKTRCLISAAGPPCSLCAEAERQCTFSLAPPLRKPRQSVASDLSHINGDLDNDVGENAEDEERTPRSASTGVVDGGKRRRSYDTLGREPNHWRRRRETTALESTSERRNGRSFNLTQAAETASSFDHLAESGFEPHVLTNPVTDDLLPIQGDETERPTDRPHVRQISSDPKRPIFVVMQPRHETALIAAYTTHVHPARPILPKGSIKQLPPNLLAAILASSFAHSRDTRPLAGLAANLLQSGSDGMGESNLITVATNIMTIGVRPGSSNQGSYLLLAHTIALAQLLGLHLDPSHWSIPAWEQELRIRLWWMLRIHDAWMSFLNSRPSHIQVDNSTAPLPRFSSLLESSCAFSPASSDSAKSFIASCRLARLVSRLQSNICTLGAVADRDQADRREEVEEILMSAEDLLDEWKASLPAQATRPPGRIHIELEHGLGAMFDTPTNALDPFDEFVTFIASMNERDLDGYFLSSLRRAAAMEDRLRKLQEHDTLCDALRGSSSTTPGDLDLDSSLPPPVAPIPGGEIAIEPQLVWDWTGAEMDLDQLLGLSSGIAS
ncbi:hypothetical protein IAU60_002540 [Kwoniella sp. DSM 27419]